jgi:hypothetical protein
MDDESNVLLRAAGRGPQRMSRLATASFASAAASMAGLVLGGFSPFITGLFLFFVPAIVLGHLARRAFRSHPGEFRNESMATFGLSVGYLGLFLSLFVIGAMIWLGAG